MATPQYSRAKTHPASRNEPDPLESRAAVLLQEAIDGDLSAATVEEQLECINRVTAAVVMAAKRSTCEHRIDWPELTERQRQIVTMLNAGMNTEEIAAELHRSGETIKWHIWNLKQIFDVRTEAGIVRKVRDIGLI